MQVGDSNKMDLYKWKKKSLLYLLANNYTKNVDFQWNMDFAI
jgi:hypothetical protein